MKGGFVRQRYAEPVDGHHIALIAVNAGAIRQASCGSRGGCGRSCNFGALLCAGGNMNVVFEDSEFREELIAKENSLRTMMKRECRAVCVR
ncbi:MAG: hypothetical protein ACLTSZ_14850 [Lachnospiraceae bacterium]